MNKVWCCTTVFLKINYSYNFEKNSYNRKNYSYNVVSCTEEGDTFLYIFAGEFWKNRKQFVYLHSIAQWVALVDLILCIPMRAHPDSVSSVLCRLLPALCLLALLCSCREVSYPPLLVQADSAYMRGDYEQADSLLAYYDSVEKTFSGSSRAYRSLLDLERKYVNELLTFDDFAVTDSLNCYYENIGDIDKNGKALLFLGEIFHVSGDYPHSNQCYMHAAQLAKACDNLVLQGWICHEQGDLYFEQGMYKECIPYFHRYYKISKICRDTLRMALAAFRMGKVYTIQNDVDSTLYYYGLSKDLGYRLGRIGQIVNPAQYQIADIYIQIGEFGKAAEIMSRDSLNMVNWAYWHAGQNHIDSAVFYFQEAFCSRDIYAQAEFLRVLSELEKKRGNVERALSYYEKLIKAEDSIKAMSQAEETKRVEAQYNYSMIEQERNEIAVGKLRSERFFLSIFIVFLVLLTLACYKINKIQQQKKVILERERLMKLEEERKYRQSIQQIENNRLRLAELENQLAIARQHDDIRQMGRLQIDTEILQLENKNIEAIHRRSELLLKEFQNSDLYVRIRLNAGNDRFRISEEDWVTLGKRIDEVYFQFTKRLLNFCKMSTDEMRVCYLLKIGISPANIAVVMNKTRSGVTMLRKRLYKKITQKEGSPKQLDDFISSF